MDATGHRRPGCLPEIADETGGQPRGQREQPAAGPGEAAESAESGTRLPHWSGPAGEPMLRYARARIMRQSMPQPAREAVGPTRVVYYTLQRGDRRRAGRRGGADGADSGVSRGNPGIGPRRAVSRIKLTAPRRTPVTSALQPRPVRACFRLGQEHRPPPQLSSSDGYSRRVWSGLLEECRTWPASSRPVGRCFDRPRLKEGAR
jgi:hypothetical protein